MFEISFEIGGKKVNPQNIGNALEEAILEQIKKSIINRVGAVSCPEHGTLAKIICKGSDLDKLSFEISGCCDKLINAVKAKLNES
jgi:hypothetical protein